MERGCGSASRLTSRRGNDGNHSALAKDAHSTFYLKKQRREGSYISETVDFLVQRAFRKHLSFIMLDLTTLQLITEGLMLLLFTIALVCQYRHLACDILFITRERRDGMWPQIYIVMDQEEVWWLGLALILELLVFKDCVQIWLGSCRGVAVEFPNDPEAGRQANEAMQRMGYLV